MDPKDEDELQDMMFTALGHDGPSAIRYPRGIGPGATVKVQPVALEIGKAEVLQDGRDVAVFALGSMVPEAWRLAKLLEAEGHSVAVINARFAKPVDAECIDHDRRPRARRWFWFGGAGEFECAGDGCAGGAGGMAG
jgi:1-deoxy-D-xylulose-5-phosphate synthase